jgi:hypothetical protein
MSLDELEKKFSDFAEEVENRIEEFGKQIDERFSNAKPTEREHRPDQPLPSKRHHDIPFWGIILIIVGFVFLGNHLHWFHFDIPWIPAALIILGFYLIFENLHRR